MATTFASKANHFEKGLEISVDIVETLDEGWVVKRLDDRPLPEGILSYNEAWVSHRYPDASFLFLASYDWYRKIEILLDLGDYKRPHDDPVRGAVYNTPTLYPHTGGRLVAGGWTHENANFFDLSPEQVEQCEALALRHGQAKVYVSRQESNIVASVLGSDETVNL